MTNFINCNDDDQLFCPEKQNDKFQCANDENHHAPVFDSPEIIVSKNILEHTDDVSIQDTSLQDVISNCHVDAHASKQVDLSRFAALQAQWNEAEDLWMATMNTARTME
jgi:hypothetical protein